MKRLIAALSMFAASPAYAQVLSHGEGFYVMCSKDGPTQSALDKPMNAIVVGCASYLSGLLDMHDVYQEARLGDVRLCVPAPHIPQTLLDITLKYMADHPEDRSQPTVVQFVGAMTRYFPCSATGTPKDMQPTDKKM